MKLDIQVALLSLLAAVPQSLAYRLRSKLAGQDLINAFTFQSGQADNGGTATYNGLSDAWNKGLRVTSSSTDLSTMLTRQRRVSIHNGAVILKVGTNGWQENRDSLRLFSKEQFNGGLFVFDIAHIPTGCGAWPSVWMTGPNWPHDGEIDLIEGVHGITQNSFSTHTSSGCTQQSWGFSGSFMMNANSWQKDVCDAYATSSQGCGVRSNSQTSYGTPFNRAKGGVYAVQWDDSGIRSHHWLRKDVPWDITAGQPNPSASWGTPDNFVDAGNCNIRDHFKNHMMVINTNLCGTWASGVWNQDLSYAGSPGSCAQKTGYSNCEDYVKNNGHAFSQAYWSIRSITIYDN